MKDADPVSLAESVATRVLVTVARNDCVSVTLRVTDVVSAGENEFRVSDRTEERDGLRGVVRDDEEVAEAVLASVWLGLDDRLSLEVSVGETVPVTLGGRVFEVRECDALNESDMVSSSFRKESPTELVFEWGLRLLSWLAIETGNL